MIGGKPHESGELKTPSIMKEYTHHTNNIGNSYSVPNIFPTSSSHMKALHQKERLKRL